MVELVTHHSIMAVADALAQIVIEHVVVVRARLDAKLLVDFEAFAGTRAHPEAMVTARAAVPHEGLTRVDPDPHPVIIAGRHFDVRQ